MTPLWKRSLAIFGIKRPQLIARMMLTAVTPSPTVVLKSSSVVFPLSAICTRPLAILNRNTPGIIETTDANPIAANGI